MCIFSLKLTRRMSYYVSKDTPGFSAFIDASKAAKSNPNGLLSQKV